MEDRYLYKAKRKDNENLLRAHYLEENMWTAEIYAIEVDASTICQCTGLKDKNGS